MLIAIPQVESQCHYVLKSLKALIANNKYKDDIDTNVRLLQRLVEEGA
jgi:hypothetical protein